MEKTRTEFWIHVKKMGKWVPEVGFSGKGLAIQVKLDLAVSGIQALIIPKVTLRP